jgi:Cation transporter/ATPase, N-terminus
MALIGNATMIKSPLLQDQQNESPDKPKETERYGLTTLEADDLRITWGYNELPTINVPLWWIFFVQFTGTMPYVRLIFGFILVVKD